MCPPLALSLNLKQELYTQCMDIVEKKIQHEIKAINIAQEASNLETKSSAGDKYETGRAMMQLEKEKHGFQLQQNQKIKQHLLNINVQTKHTSVSVGSLVCTDQGNYFLAISVGELKINNIDVMTLSIASPLGKALLNQQPGFDVQFRGKSFKVLTVI